ncbi:M10 family metallopeptidase C-terminal domain-containing protein [Pseudomonas poae]|nr:M10 family metallopeptidase C-terminal domain-containing protein [Pseudomonas poae]
MAGELAHLGSHIDGRAIERMLRAPDAQMSQSLLKKVGTLLTPENTRNLLGSEHAKTCTESLGKLENQCAKTAIAPVLSNIGAEHINTFRRQADSATLDLLYTVLTDAPGSFLPLIRKFITQQEQPFKHAQDCLKGLGTQETTFAAIAALVRKAIEEGQHPHPSEPPAAIYRYTHTGESSLDAPSEIRHFVPGRDKLDVSGIHRQLDRPLQWVNQLSGEPGEMQLHYSHAHNASVLVISGNRGELPFVAKVFSPLKESDVII